MEFIKQFGLDWWLIYAQVVNFGILFVVLTVFVYKPIIKEIEKEKERRKKIEEAEAVAEALTKQKEHELQNARTHAQSIITEAQSIAEDLRKKTHEETQLEKRAILDQIARHAGIGTYGKKAVKPK